MERLSKIQPSLRAEIQRMELPPLPPAGPAIIGRHFGTLCVYTPHADEWGLPYIDRQTFVEYLKELCRDSCVAPKGSAMDPTVDLIVNNDVRRYRSPSACEAARRTIDRLRALVVERRCMHVDHSLHSLYSL